MSNLTIDTTVSGTTSNSYATLAEARAEAAELMDGNVFLDKTEEEQTLFLVNAARNMNGLKYVGSKYSSDQALAFPRDVTPDAADDDDDTDSGVIPTIVKTAQVMEAMALAGGRRPQRGGDHTIGGVTYTARGTTLAGIHVLQMLNVYGWVQATGNAKISNDVF